MPATMARDTSKMTQSQPSRPCRASIAAALELRKHIIPSHNRGNRSLPEPSPYPLAVWMVLVCYSVFREALPKWVESLANSRLPSLRPRDSFGMCDCQQRYVSDDLIRQYVTDEQGMPVSVSMTGEVSLTWNDGESWFVCVLVCVCVCASA